MSGASLTDPVVGGLLDDQDVTCIESKTGEYTYPGGATTNALILTLQTDDGAEYVEAYSSGVSVGTKDETGFETTPKDNSKAKRFIMAMVGLGVAVGNTVKVFEKLKFHVKREALPKMRGIDKEGDKDKTILLPTAILKAGKATAAPKATVTSNGSLDEAATRRILAALNGAPDQTLGRVKLATTVWLVAQKEKDPAALQYKKLAGDANWLNEHAGESWVVNGDEVVLIPKE